MFWIFLLMIIGFISLFVFSLRFSPHKIGSFPIVQFIYLFFSAPLISMCLINLGFEIHNRPSLHPAQVEDLIILSLYIIVVVTGALGSGIHSIAVTISQALLEHSHLQAYTISEFIHNKLSHEMLYINQMNVAFLLFILELNHPLPNSYDPGWLILIGILLGIISAGAMILGTLIKLNLIIAISLTLLASVLAPTVLSQPNYFPIAFASYISLLTIVFSLLIAWLTFKYTKGLVIRCVTVIFPKGHKIRIELDCN